MTQRADRQNERQQGGAIVLLRLAALVGLFVALSGIRPATAAGASTHPFGQTTVLAPAGAVHNDTTPCSDPNAICAEGGHITETVFAVYPPTGQCTGSVTIAWGDGTSDSGPFVNGVYAQSHQYPADGEYTLAVTATDSCGNFGYHLLIQVIGLAAGPAGGPLTGGELLGYGSPSVPQLGCTCSSSADPVNALTGNLIESLTDLAIPGRGLPIDLTQTYNSLAAADDGPLGHGWTMPSLMHLSFDQTGNATLDEEAGSQITFTNTNGTYTAAPRIAASLTQNPDGSFTLVRDHRLTYTFTAAGQLTGEQDRNGYVTRLSYSNGQLSAITDPAGRQVRVSWSGGHITGFADPSGRTISLAYDGAGDLVSVTQQQVATTAAHWHLGYDAQNDLTSVTDPRGLATTNTYDAAHRVIRQVLDPTGLDRVTTWTYTTNPDGTETTTMVDPKGNQTDETFQFGELVKLVRGVGTPSAATWTFAYDPVSIGRTLTVDPNGHRWTATYDARGNLLTRTDPLSRTTTFTYDAQNDLLTTTDPMGVTTTNTYDDHGNLLSTSTPLAGTDAARTTTAAYGDPTHRGDLTAMTDADGNTWHYTYDRYGDRTSTTDPEGNETTWSYNTIGWLLSSVSPRGNVPGGDPAHFRTTVTRTPFFGDVAAGTDPLGHTTTNSYDPDQNLIRTTDPLGHTTIYSYDRANEQIAIHRPNGNTLQSAYYPDGTLASQTDALGHTTRYSYDPLGQLAAVIDPLGRTTAYVSDGVGNLDSITLPDGQITANTYDGANELQSISYSDGTTPDVGSMTYDQDGRLTGMTDGTGNTTWTYDSLGDLTSVTDGAGAHVGYVYDLKGQVTELTYPDGQQVTREYDRAGRLTAVTDWLGNTTHFSYDPDSNLVQTQFPGSQTDSATYDDADRLTAIADTAGSQILASFSYTRNAASLLTRQTSTGLGQPLQTDSYTALNQVAQVVAPTTAPGAGSQATSYSYDAADNLTQMGHAALGYDAADELTAIANGTTHANLTYDQQGNRLSTAPSSGTPTAYAYDQANRLIDFTRGSAGATYSYDGLGVRVAETVNGSTTPLVWDREGALPLLLQDGTRAYLYGPGDSPFEQITGTSVRYLHHDQVGSVRLLTDAAGHATGTASFDAYGNRVTDHGESSPFGFAGAYTDGASGLLLLGARAYDPVMGQFLQRDPLETVTREPYAYAGGDPVNATDPSGLLGPRPDGGSFGGTVPVLAPKAPDTGSFGGTVPILAPGSGRDAGAAGPYPPGPVPAGAGDATSACQVAFGGGAGDSGLPDFALGEGDGAGGLPDFAFGGGAGDGGLPDFADGGFGGAGGLPDFADAGGLGVGGLPDLRPTAPNGGRFQTGGGGLPDLHPSAPDGGSLGGGSLPDFANAGPLGGGSLPDINGTENEGDIAESGSLATGGAI